MVSLIRFLSVDIPPPGIPVAGAAHPAIGALPSSGPLWTALETCSRARAPDPSRLAKRPEQSDTHEDQHELNAGQQAVEIDALVEAVPRYEPGMGRAVREVEDDSHEDATERCEDRRREDRDPTAV